MRGCRSSGLYGDGRRFANRRGDQRLRIGSASDALGLLSSEEQPIASAHTIAAATPRAIRTIAKL